MAGLFPPDAMLFLMYAGVAWAIAPLSSNPDKQYAAKLFASFAFCGALAFPILAQLPEAYYVLVAAYDVALIWLLARKREAYCYWVAVPSFCALLFHAVQGRLFSEGNELFFSTYVYAIMCLNIIQLLILFTGSDEVVKRMARGVSFLRSNRLRF